MSHRFLAAAVLALSLTPLHGTAQEADTAQLRFGWTPGMRAEVEYDRVRVRTTEEGQDSTYLAYVYRLETEPHPEGMRLRFAGMRWTELPELEGPAGQFLQAIGRIDSGGKPSYVVSQAGEFLRLEGTEQMADELRAAFQPIMAELQGEGLAALRNMMEAMLSEEGLAGAAANEWSTLVEAWADTDMAMSDLFVLEDSFQTPVFPGVDIPITIHIDMIGRVPCTEAEVDDDAPRCVELQTTSIPEREAMRQAIGGFIQQLGLPEEEVDEVLSQLRVETYVKLVTEPGTLRPHSMQTIKVVSGGVDEEPMQWEMETYRYRWR
ncbi:MAG TPA: hypothetical protein VFR37_24820 [Longimicrobium sp.]|nr:hypothetical protein [Longimicrobium sp.]